MLALRPLISYFSCSRSVSGTAITTPFAYNQMNRPYTHNGNNKRFNLIKINYGLCAGASKMDFYLSPSPSTMAARVQPITIAAVLKCTHNDIPNPCGAHVVGICIFYYHSVALYKTNSSRTRRGRYRAFAYSLHFS